MSVISRYSSLEEFVDKFFLILSVLRCERDHKAALCSQKVPTTFHSAADVYSTKYMRYLTPYAYKFVEKQLHLRKQVVIVMHSCNSEVYEVKMGVTSTKCYNQCCCRLWVSMKLPCCHIFFVRDTLGLDLFDECICDQRWTMQYYESNQRVFLTKGASHSNSAQVSVVTLPEKRKKVLSQVHYIIFYACT